MDREQILEDLKSWLRRQMYKHNTIDPARVLDKIDKLEEEYE